MFKEKARIIFTEIINNRLDKGGKLKKISHDYGVTHACIKQILEKKTYPGLQLWYNFCVLHNVDPRAILEPEQKKAFKKEGP